MLRIDDFRPTVRIPHHVRERLGIPTPVDIRFGMDEPVSPLDQPGGIATR